MDIKRFYRPRSMEEALATLASCPAVCRVVAGGTDILLQLRRGSVTCDYLVDLTLLDDLKRIEPADDGVAVGAGVTMQQLADSPLINRHYSALAEAAASLGSLQVRNRATVGGNLARSSPAADSVCALVALRAQVKIRSAFGSREVAASDFALGPGQNVLRPDEIVTHAWLPALTGAHGSKYIKLGRRKALVLAVVGAAASLLFEDDGRVRQCGIGLASVGPTIVRARSAERALQGQVASAEAIAHAAELAGREVNPISDVRGSEWYRTTVTPVLVRRALMAAWEQARSPEVASSEEQVAGLGVRGNG